MGRIGEHELSSSVVEKLNKSASLSKYKYIIDLSLWGESDNGLYYYYIQHNLNLNKEDIINIKLIDDDTAEEVFISYRILDKNSLYIYSIGKCNGILIINY